MGIEPTSSAWKAEVLPLNYTRLYAFLRRAKILTVCLSNRPDFIKLSLCLPLGGSANPVRHPVQIVSRMVEGVGFEPT